MARRKGWAWNSYYANKARLEAAGPSGVPSEKTLRSRAYDVDPQGGGPKVPPPPFAPDKPRKKQKQKRKRQATAPEVAPRESRQWDP